MSASKLIQGTFIYPPNEWCTRYLEDIVENFGNRDISCHVYPFVKYWADINRVLTQSIFPNVNAKSGELFCKSIKDITVDDFNGDAEAHFVYIFVYFPMIGRISPTVMGRIVKCCYCGKFALTQRQYSCYCGPTCQKAMHHQREKAARKFQLGY